MELFFARQPIFDVAERVVGYELAHRAAGGEAPESSAFDATVQVLVDAIMGAGLDRVGEGRPVFVKVSSDVIASETVRLLSPGTLVFELDADAPCDDALRHACAALRDAGHKLALAGFHADARARELVPFVHVVKIDAHAVRGGALQAAATAAAGGGRILIAERVNDRAERDRCVALGFRYFQGYRFTRPETVVRRDLDMNHLAIFRTMRDLLDHTVSDREVEAAFARDVSLSYRLLRIVNSAAVGGTEIWSIGHAVRLLGRVALYRWLSMCLLASSSGQGVTEELQRAALVRARWCELLAEAAGVPRAAPSLFLVGLFSLLDVITGVPIDELMRQIEPAADVREAILTRADWFGATLALVEAWENADWPEVLNRSYEVGIETEELPRLYRAALEWAGTRSSDASIAA
ncbi:MAG: HDOD domain-containing protein [Gemmatimonadetes bacterium]|nr:HDOD domain-containing protein [Gemmatimonadota bacterium]